MGCRRGCLVGLLGAVLALLLVLEGSDILARHYATSKIAQRIRSREPSAQGVSVHIRSFPFLKVLLNGHVDEIGARIARITVGPLAFVDVDVELHGLTVQKGQVFQGHVNVTSLHTGTVTATVTAAALSQATGIPVTVGPGELIVRGIPVKVSVNPSTRQLLINGLQPFGLPSSDVLPCIPIVTFTAQGVGLSCTFTHVPSAFSNVGT
jgi:hypothetical protein